MNTDTDELDKSIDGLSVKDATRIIKREIADATKHLTHVSLKSSYSDGSFTDPAETIRHLRVAYCHTQIALAAASGCFAWQEPRLSASLLALMQGRNDD